MIKKTLSSIRPKIYTVHTEWDARAKMWVAYSDDIPGLATEASDIETLKKRVKALAIDILNEENSETNSSVLAIDTKPMYFSLGESTACG